MINVHELPYLTADTPGVGGVIKQRPEDFRVEEVSLYEPGGEGTHVYFTIEKKNLPTMQAVNIIARALGRNVRDIGYAGLKDADAVTRQTLSLEHIEPARIEQLELNNISVVAVSRHTNKLKLGHLKGNRFAIRLRQVDPGRADDVRTMLEMMSRRGVPNYFGPQRFGLRGDTWQIGKALLCNQYDDAVSVILGRPGPLDRGDIRQARELFEQGDYAAAAESWPYPFHNERRLARQMDKTGGDARKAFRCLDKKLVSLYYNAYQSQLFNQIVAGRLQAIDALWQGDLAWRHPQGAVFKVEDVERERPRCEVFEISPTGPLFGYRMSQPEGPALAMEEEILRQENMSLDDWREAGRLRIKGSRRPLRFQPQEVAVDAGSDEHGDYIETRFFLESGCYATTVLREVCKMDVESNAGQDDEAD